MLKWISKSSVLPPVILGFTLMIALLAFSWHESRQHMQHLYQTVESSRMASDKMQIIASMIEIARSRSRLTNQMLHTDDPFAKDEINVELNHFASEFALLRQALNELELSDIEQDILRRQSEAIRPTLALQRKAAEMALSGDPKVVREAQRILVEDVYTGQGVIIDYFMQLLRLQKDAIDENTRLSAIEFSDARNHASWLLTFVLLTAIAIALFVASRTTRIENALFLEKERALITLRSIGDAVITTDEAGLVTYLNPVAEKITGHLTGDVQGRPITQVFRAYDEVNQRWLADCIVRFLSVGNFSLPSNDIVLHTADGDQLDIALTIAPIRSARNEVLGTIATFQDITKTKSLARRIEHQARHDPLTGLLNRREFELKVNQALLLYAEETTHALCVIDLDRFKIVNDTAGHTAGDELLRQISLRIRGNLRKSDLFARIGGDEFAIFLSNIPLNEAVRIAETIVATVREFQFFWNKKSFRVGASIGLVDAPSDASDYEYLYHAADNACYIAKHEGRDRVSVVSLDDKWLTEKRAQTHWANRINEALQNDQFVLFGQDIRPLKNARSTHCPGHREILIRLRDTDGEIIPPMAFIPAAERYNLMPQIDEWVTRHVILLIEQSRDDTVYSVNLSGQSMGDKKFADRIMPLIDRSSIDTSRLCFEITETAAIGNLENAQNFLKKLKALGCQTALDDFGSGLSSFAYLRNLPIDYLKIDGMFVKQIAEDGASRVMVEAIHAIGRTMNLKTIAEFVENQAVVDTLSDIGIDFGQGYFFDKPSLIYEVSPQPNLTLVG